MTFLLIATVTLNGAQNSSMLNINDEVVKGERLEAGML